MDRDQDEDRKEVVFIGDPMCSWCWGFAPVLSRIAKASRGKAAFLVMLGGLRPGTRAAMDAKMKAYVSEHWRNVAARTGQSFDFSFFEREGFVYDTEPACRAVVTVRGIAPAMALAYFEAVQTAFYTQGRDVTDPAVLGGLAQGFGIDAGMFREAMDSPSAKEATMADFSLARRMGVSAFPTVVLADAEENSVLTVGWRPWEQVGPGLERWLGDGAS